MGWPQFAIGINTARQQVVQQALLDGLELGDEGLGFVDGGVEDVEDFCDLSLLGMRRRRQPDLTELGARDFEKRCSRRAPGDLRLNFVKCMQIEP